jgi:uncharacterized iron-regulated membrane protein
LSIALAAGAFLVILGVTGSILSFEPELDRLFHSDLSYVSPRGRVLTLQEIGDAVSRVFAGEPIVAYLPSTSPGISAQVVLPRGIVYVNQYTGEVLGVRTRGQTFLGLVRALHTRLGAGDIGRSVLKWSGVAILILLASGSYLWWPAKRVRIRGGWRRPGFWFDVHNSVGILSLLPLLVLAATGTAIGFEDQAESLLEKVTGSAPDRAVQWAAPQEPATGAVPITPDQAVVIACAAIPGTIAVRVQMPRYGGVYRVSLENPRGGIAGEDNMVAIDPNSGNVLSSVRSNDLSSAKRILAENEAIHTGGRWGMPSKLLACLASVVVPVQMISGILVWLHRRKVARLAK